MPSPALPAPPEPAVLRRALQGLRRPLLAMFGFSAVITALLLTPSIYMLQVYDRVLSSRSEFTLLVLSVLVLGLYAVLSALEQVRAVILARLAVRMDRQLSDAVFDAAFEHARRSGGQPALATQDLTTLRQFVGGPVPALAFDAPLALVFLVAAFVVDSWLGGFVLASVVVLVALAAATERTARAPLEAANAAAQRAASRMAGAFRNVEAIAALGMLEPLRRRWQLDNQAALGHQDQAARAAGRIGMVTKFVRLSAQSLALGLGALLVLEHRITPGMMIAATILLGRALAPVEGLLHSLRQIVAAREAWQRLSALLEHHAAAPQPMALPEASGRLRVERLRLGPPGASQPVLHDIDFELPPGEVLGVIGPSASGKSTLARALVGVWSPLSGTVRLDGAELAHWPPAQRSRALGYLPQDVELFDATVRENIARLQDGDDAAVVAAAQLCGVHELILSLPDGYDTLLGAGGRVLSAGQRQRIGLARAVYGQPRLIVLDEPNANLDDAGEAALLQCVQRCRAAGSSVVVISHRTSVLQAASRVLVLNAGHVVLLGPAEEVWPKLASLAARREAVPLGSGLRGPRAAS